MNFKNGRGAKRGLKIGLVALTFAVAILGLCLFGIVKTDESDSSIPDEITVDGLIYSTSMEWGYGVKVKGYERDSHVFEIPRTIEYYGETYPVLEIGYEAFKGSNVQKLVIPDTVEKIGAGAFSSCICLDDLTIPISINTVVNGGHPAFPQNNHIRKVSFTPGDGYGFDYHFKDRYPFNKHHVQTPWYCSDSIREIVLYEGIVTLGECTFRGMNIEHIVLPGSLQGINHRAFAECHNLKTIKIPNNVASIGYAAFHSCTSLEEVTLPEGISHLDQYIFQNCNSLKSITIPEGLKIIEDKVFYECTGLEKVQLPKGLESIRIYAFFGCKNLREITIPEGVKEIQDWAFAECKTLVDINIPVSLKKINGGVFDKCISMESIELHDGIEEINGWAFSHCYSLKSIKLPDGLQRIGERAFYDCDMLTSLTIPGNVKVIDREAFEDCDSLVSLTIEAAAMELGTLSFKDCKKLESITAPISVDLASKYEEWMQHENPLVGELVWTTQYAFKGCENIEIITFTKGTGVWHEYGDAYQLTPWCLNKSSMETLIFSDGVPCLPAGGFGGFKNLKNLSLPISIDSVVNDESPAFKDSKKIKTMAFTPGTGEVYTYTNPLNTPWQISKSKIENVLIAEGVTSLSPYMFQECTKIKQITLPESTIHIPEGAFMNCKSLEGIVIPDSVKSIGNQAFSGCERLETIQFGNGLTSIGEDAFEGFIFYDSNEEKLPHTLENLMGNTFTGNPSRMVKQ